MPTCTALLWVAWPLVDPSPSWVLSDTTRFSEGVESLLYGAAALASDVRDGRLAVGYDADVTLVDLKRRRAIEASWIASPCGWTPFDGMTCTGWPVATIVRGNVVMRDDAVQGRPVVRLARFGNG